MLALDDDKAVLSALYIPVHNGRTRRAFKTCARVQVSVGSPLQEGQIGMFRRAQEEARDVVAREEEEQARRAASATKTPEAVA